jgi:hypothetical protein
MLLFLPKYVCCEARKQSPLYPRNIFIFCDAREQRHQRTSTTLAHCAVAAYCTDHASGVVHKRGCRQIVMCVLCGDRHTVTIHGFG